MCVFVCVFVYVRVCVIKKWPEVETTVLFQGGINQVAEMKDNGKCYWELKNSIQPGRGKPRNAVMTIR